MVVRQWSNIVTVCCIIIAALFQASEQALSGSPQTATHLPNFHGWGNYIPLGVLVIAGVSWLIGHYSKKPDMSPQSLVLATSNAQSRGVPHTPGTFDSVDFFRTAYISPLQDTGANSIRAEAERVRPRDKESFYLDLIAVGIITMMYDGLWWPIFRSQHRALLELNKNHGLVPLSTFQKFYDEAKAEFPDAYAKKSFDSWMEYLSGNTLLIVHPSKMVEITAKGKDFLKYLLHWGRSEETKRL